MRTSERRKSKVTEFGDVLANQRRLLLGSVFLLFLLLGGCTFAQPTATPTSIASYNGATIDPRFQAFHDENGGVELFGYPLASYEDELTGTAIQYFQRMRLELEPDEQEIIITALGEWAVPEAADQVPAPVPEDDLEDASAASELSVRDAFASFYYENGGEQFFGRPISSQLIEGGIRVQYFENARLEWHPEAPLEFRVQVGLLGEAHFRQIGRFRDPARYRAVESVFVEEAAVSANVRAPILYAGEEQVLFVDVETPDGRRPVPDVTIKLSLDYDGKTVASDLGVTDGNGHAQSVLALPDDIAPGQKVMVEIVAESPRKQIGTTAISFKTWW